MSLSLRGGSGLESRDIRTVPLRRSNRSRGGGKRRTERSGVPRRVFDGPATPGEPAIGKAGLDASGAMGGNEEPRHATGQSHSERNNDDRARRTIQTPNAVALEFRELDTKRLTLLGTSEPAAESAHRGAHPDAAMPIFRLSKPAAMQTSS